MAAGIGPAVSGFVVVKSFFQIIGGTDVETVVGTKEDVDKIGHLVRLAC